jgi:FkbM family methyltransferase
MRTEYLGGRRGRKVPPDLTPCAPARNVPPCLDLPSGFAPPGPATPAACGAEPLAGPLERLRRLNRAFRTHPVTSADPRGAWLRWTAWQARSRLVPGAVPRPFVGETRLLIRRGDSAATGNLYFGLYEAEGMAFVGHLLREGDLFVDVGANIGAYAVLAAGVCGARAWAFEPVPAVYRSLLQNLALNGLGRRVSAQAVAVGAAPGRVRMSAGLDVINHVLTDAGTAGVDVPVVTLDALLADRAPGPFFIKIDVEGYEAAVIAGATATLASPDLLGLLLELTPQADRYGFDDAALHAGLLARGFTAYDYDPRRRTLSPRREAVRRGNMLYLQDLEVVRARVESAPALQVLDQRL